MLAARRGGDRKRKQRRDKLHGKMKRRRREKTATCQSNCEMIFLFDAEKYFILQFL